MAYAVDSELNTASAPQSGLSPQPHMSPIAFQWRGRESNPPAAFWLLLPNLSAPALPKARICTVRASTAIHGHRLRVGAHCSLLAQRRQVKLVPGTSGFDQADLGLDFVLGPQFRASGLRHPTRAEACGLPELGRGALGEGFLA